MNQVTGTPARWRAGFTLAELLVVAAIISILSGIVYFSAQDSSALSRDAKRQADLRNLEAALELHKNRYGEYPLGCNGADDWSGQTGTNYECTSGTEYIVGLAPEFIPSLPRDPRLDGQDSGYAYYVNAEQTVYKLYAWRTVEAETVDFDHEFVGCDSFGVCANVDFVGGGTPPWCQLGNDLFSTSYAVWGGFADGPNASQREENTEEVICQRPTP